MAGYSSRTLAQKLGIKPATKQLSPPPRRFGGGFPRLARALADNGSLWISWPKKTSGVDTDLTEDVVRAIGLEQGLVDVKVCAVDEVWSGLKFVRRLENRAR